MLKRAPQLFTRENGVGHVRFFNIVLYKMTISLKHGRKDNLKSKYSEVNFFTFFSYEWFKLRTEQYIYMSQKNQLINSCNLYAQVNQDYGYHNINNNNLLQKLFFFFKIGCFCFLFSFFLVDRHYVTAYNFALQLKLACCHLLINGWHHNCLSNVNIYPLCCFLVF